MAIFRHILVDIDPTAATHPALVRAFDLAARTGARLTIVDVLPHVPKAARVFATPDIEQELAQHRIDALARAAGQAPGNIQVETGLLRGRPAQALISEASRLEVDLVMRSHGRDLVTPAPAFGPIDMQLLRHCPCPVWLVGPADVAPPSRIAAAIDATTERDEERELNQRILDIALTLGELWDASVAVLHAWTAFGEDLLRSRMNVSEFEVFQHESRKAVENALKAALTTAGPRAEKIRTELVKAEPHEAILDYVKTNGIDLVVMGSVARKGIAGAVIGNTAERVLRDLRQSVLTIKPRGFTSALAD